MIVSLGTRTKPGQIWAERTLKPERDLRCHAFSPVQALRNAPSGAVNPFGGVRALLKPRSSAREAATTTRVPLVNTEAQLEFRPHRPRQRGGGSHNDSLDKPYSHLTWIRVANSPYRRQSHLSVRASLEPVQRNVVWTCKVIGCHNRSVDWCTNPGLDLFSGAQREELIQC